MTRRQALACLAGLCVSPVSCRIPSDSRQTLRIANWGAAGDDSEFYRLVQQIFRDFESEFGVRLRIEGTPGSQEYVSKLLLDHISGTMPDVVTLDASSSAAFIDHGALLDLSSFIEKDSDFDLGDFYPNVVEIASRPRGKGLNDAVFAVPTDFTPMVMYLNKRLIHNVPIGSWSFDDFLRIAIDSTRDGVYGFDFSNWMPGWVMFLWNNGSDVLSPDGSRATGFFDSPMSVEAVQFLADLVLKHKVAPDLSQAAATGVDFFATGRAAMKVSGHWYLVGLPSSKDIDMVDVVINELPTNLDKSITVMYEAGNAIGARCKHPELAWKFLKYFSSEQVQHRYNRSGIAICARKDVSKARFSASQMLLGLSDTESNRAESLHRAQSDRNRAFERIVPTARPPWGATVLGYDRVEDHGQKALDAVLKNGVSVKEALSQAAHDIDLELSKR